MPENLNTDLLGTISGEVKRKDAPLTVARKKCLLAMAMTNCDLAIASEGSFGTHPSLFLPMRIKKWSPFVYTDNGIVHLWIAFLFGTIG